jgi:Uma2 family endonuclease
MKAVMADVSEAPVEAYLKQRKLAGADRYDEMWDGVLHMPPMPNRFHQDLEGALESFLRSIWAPRSHGKVYHQINLASIGGWPNNYRIPDLLMVLPERFAIDRNEYFEGPPNVVVEIHSPDDESYDKLPFYAKLGIPEVWIINRDTCEPEVYQLKRNRYRKVAASADVWYRSAETGIELRRGNGNKLAVRLAGDETTRQELPSD